MLAYFGAYRGKEGTWLAKMAVSQTINARLLAERIQLVPELIRNLVSTRELGGCCKPVCIRHYATMCKAAAVVGYKEKFRASPSPHAWTLFQQRVWIKGSTHVMVDTNGKVVRFPMKMTIGQFNQMIMTVTHESGLADVMAPMV